MHVIGVAYKRDVNDLRESPALEVLELLDKGGAKPTYLDPAAMRAQIDMESKYFGDVIKRANIKV